MDPEPIRLVAYRWLFASHFPLDIFVVDSILIAILNLPLSSLLWLSFAYLNSMPPIIGTRAQTSLKLQRPLFPTASYFRDIAKDPLLCGVCCNLYPGTAYSLFPRNDIFVNEASGSWNQWYAARAIDRQKTPNWSGNRCGITRDEVVPSSPLDLAPWQITASLPDIATAAQEGCPSCQLLKSGIQHLGNAEISFSDVDLSLDIVFCKGDMLRATVARTAPVEENDESIFAVNGWILTSFTPYQVGFHS